MEDGPGARARHHDGVTSQTVSKVAVVQFVEDRLQVEIPSRSRGLGLGKGELPLHGQCWMCDFAFLPSHLVCETRTAGR